MIPLTALKLRVIIDVLPNDTFYELCVLVLKLLVWLLGLCSGQVSEMGLL